MGSRAFLIICLVLLAIILIADLVHFNLPPDTGAWWAGAALSYVIARLPWWP
jgi:hypothetical protein